MEYTMPVTFKKITETPSSIVSTPRPVKQRGHVIPRSPLISLDNPGRLRSANVLALCGFSHSTLYSRMKKGTFPLPDGKDGGLNYWNTETIRSYLGN